MLNVLFLSSHLRTQLILLHLNITILLLFNLTTPRRLPWCHKRARGMAARLWRPFRPSSGNLKLTHSLVPRESLPTPLHVSHAFKDSFRGPAKGHMSLISLAPRPTATLTSHWDCPRSVRKAVRLYHGWSISSTLSFSLLTLFYTNSCMQVHWRV